MNKLYIFLFALLLYLSYLGYLVVNPPDTFRYSQYLKSNYYNNEHIYKLKIPKTDQYIIDLDIVDAVNHDKEIKEEVCESNQLIIELKNIKGNNLVNINPCDKNKLLLLNLKKGDEIEIKLRADTTSLNKKDFLILFKLTIFIAK